MECKRELFSVAMARRSCLVCYHHLALLFDLKQNLCSLPSVSLSRLCGFLASKAFWFCLASNCHFQLLLKKHFLKNLETSTPWCCQLWYSHWGCHSTLSSRTFWKYLICHHQECSLVQSRALPGNSTFHPTIVNTPGFQISLCAGHFGQ
jgi:hypothetical protein